VPAIRSSTGIDPRRLEGERGRSGDHVAGHAPVTVQLRDDPAWMASETRRLERMAPFQEELITSSFFQVAEEVVPPGARSSSA
jgi:hypothetical protein